MEQQRTRNLPRYALAQGVKDPRPAANLIGLAVEHEAKLKPKAQRRAKSMSPAQAAMIEISDKTVFNMTRPH
ncbi:MAG: hypothetical protein ACI97A_001074 [Planctomycetota bacterium]|jgi:hypothetical protein